jgi:prolyl-tRNA editing enzyme YbaK/EbsC (Cys-tRNA(Pro) deacylase)
MPLRHPTVARVTEVLRLAGAAGAPVALADAAPTAAAAAEQLGCELGAIADSLVFRADPEFVRAHTGMAISGVAPVGHPQPVRTLVDVDLATYPVVWAAAGHPHTVFPTSYTELLSITGGVAAEVA